MNKSPRPGPSYVHAGTMMDPAWAPRSSLMGLGLRKRVHPRFSRQREAGGGDGGSGCG